MPKSTGKYAAQMALTELAPIEQRHAGHRLPLDHHRQHDGVNQRNAQALRRHGGERADAHPHHHCEKDFEMEDIQEPFNRGVNK